jgi:hypothetical protein
MLLIIPAMIVLRFGNREQKQQAPRPAGALERMGLSSLGKGLALDQGGDAMWFLPLGITFSVRKTRTGWSVSVRVNFNS